MEKNLFDKAVGRAWTQDLRELQKHTDMAFVFRDALLGGTYELFAPVVDRRVQDEKSPGYRVEYDLSGCFRRACRSPDAVLKAWWRARIIAAHYKRPDQRVVVALAKEPHAFPGVYKVSLDPPLREGQIPVRVSWGVRSIFAHGPTCSCLDREGYRRRRVPSSAGVMGKASMVRTSRKALCALDFMKGKTLERFLLRQTTLKRRRIEW